MTPPLPQIERPTHDPPSGLAAPATEDNAFVINLCSSTTPMALTQPQLAELKSYKFFVSRRLEDGRERFRLHMGYFDSLLQAEELLPMVRDLYPGAWAGEAPGKRLRARAAAAQAPLAAPVKPVAPVVARVAPPPVVAAVTRIPVVPTLTEAPDATVVAMAPTLQAEETELTLVAPPLLTAAMVEEHVAAVTAQMAPSPAPAAEPVFELTLVAEPEAPAVPVEPAAPVAQAAPEPAPRAVAPKRAAKVSLDQRSNVREVLKSLDESGRSLAPPAPPPVVAAPVAAPPVAVSPAVAPAAAPAREPGPLPESQVLRLLEEKRGDPLNTVSTPAAFAVQLQWSVQPIDIAQVPQLAIFGAYMLYTVEGSREGRKWYGLRLGFFSDANSAKSVAQYVRSEFASVAVVPVSLRERDSANAANGGGPKPAAQAGAEPAAAPEARVTERVPDRSGEFKLLDDAAETPKLGAGAKPKPISVSEKAALRPGAKGTKGRGNRVQASAKRGPKTLEETLEILGADQLQIEGAKKKPTPSITTRHLDVKMQKNSAFSRLLDRLAERNR